MINGAILSKSPDKTHYTYLNKIFQAMNSFQTSYNWLITDCVAYPKNTACADCIAQAVHGGWVWLSGEELTMLVKTEDFQWIWAVLSGFDKQIPQKEVLSYPLPQAVDYEGFWKEDLSIQHPLAAVELAAYNSSAVLLLSRESTPIQSFRQAFTHSRDLKEYNTAVIQTCRETSIHPA